MTQPPSSLPYASQRTPTPRKGGGPPSWGPFITAAAGVVVAGVMIVIVAAGWMPLTMSSVPFVMIPDMIAAFTLSATSMGWMFLLFGRFGRRTRWLWFSSILIGVIILELFFLTYLAGVADAAANGG